MPAADQSAQTVGRPRSSLTCPARPAPAVGGNLARLDLLPFPAPCLAPRASRPIQGDSSLFKPIQAYSRSKNFSPTTPLRLPTWDFGLETSDSPARRASSSFVNPLPSWAGTHFRRPAQRWWPKIQPHSGKIRPNPIKSDQIKPLNLKNAFSPFALRHPSRLRTSGFGGHALHCERV